MTKNNRKEWFQAGFIPDIYNYCDRWCDRCEFRASCLSYRLEQKAIETGEELPLERILQDPFPLWESIQTYLNSKEGERRIQEIFPESLWEEPEEREEEEEDEEEDEEEPECFLEMLDLLRVSLVYETWAEHALEEAYTALDDLTEAEREKAEAVTAAVESIDWQLDVIHPKLQQAVYYLCRSEKGVPAGVGEPDYNGSAKVALLSVEQSGQAWLRLIDLLPCLAREGAHLPVILSELREEALKHFPLAMEFKRPGFDE